LTFAKLYKASNYVIPAPISSAGGGYCKVWSPIRPKHGAFGKRAVFLTSAKAHPPRGLSSRATLHELPVALNVTALS